MQINEYQNLTQETTVYPDANHYTTTAIIYCTLGLVGESGEIANKVKKILRDYDGLVTDITRDELRKELGDVFWYLARLADELEFDLDSIARENITKLMSRKERGKLRGSGDDR